MKAVSAGILLYRRRPGALEVLLGHPGGPFWTRRDDGAWTIPKGLVHPGEEPFAAARREFTEETGVDPGGEGHGLAPCRQPSGKVIHAWAVEGDCDCASVRSNLFTMEWPPGSGRIESFPEIDRAEWFAIERAKVKIVRGQVPLLQALQEWLRERDAT